MGENALKTMKNPDRPMDTTQPGLLTGHSRRSKCKNDLHRGPGRRNRRDVNDFDSQFDRAFDNLLAVLREAVGQAEDFVKITAPMNAHDADRFAYVVKSRRVAFGDNRPAGNLMPVMALAFE
jgi:hypothetical protein